MAKLTTRGRKALPKKDFALPGSRKYPVDTKARAINAKGRAEQQLKKGNISASTKRKIDAKANRVIGRKRK